MSFPKYPKYQDTGLTWLAEAPEHWRVIAPKRVMKSCSGGTLIKGECAAEPEEGLFPAFSASGQDVWVERADYSAPGIVLSAVGARCGKTFKADGEWGVVANTHCLFPEGNQSRDFFWHLTNREDWWETGGTAQPFVKVRETLARTWCLPPANEQRCISNFLDRETAKIDALIAEQQRLIELLQEKRQAVISHAVTKGLNANAPMKDSGVEWLGEVPVHWEVAALNYVLDAVGDVDHYMPPSTDEGVPYVMTGDLQELASQIDFDSCKKIATSDYERLCRKIKTSKGDLIMARYATIGTVAYVDVQRDLAVSYSCVTIKPDASKVSGKHLFFYLKSDSFAQGIRQRVNANTQENVGIGDLKTVKIAIPPLHEQQDIVNCLQLRTAEMEKVIAISKDTVKLLQERRTALISAAVTGQIDVRGLLEAEAGEQ